MRCGGVQFAGSVDCNGHGVGKRHGAGDPGGRGLSGPGSDRGGRCGERLFLLCGIAGGRLAAGGKRGAGPVAGGGTEPERFGNERGADRQRRGSEPGERHGDRAAGERDGVDQHADLYQRRQRGAGHHGCPDQRRGQRIFHDHGRSGFHPDRRRRSDHGGLYAGRPGEPFRCAGDQQHVAGESLHDQPLGLVLCAVDEQRTVFGREHGGADERPVRADHQRDGGRGGGNHSGFRAKLGFFHDAGGWQRGREGPARADVGQRRPRGAGGVHGEPGGHAGGGQSPERFLDRELSGGAVRRGPRQRGRHHPRDAVRGGGGDSKPERDAGGGDGGGSGGGWRGRCAGGFDEPRRDGGGRGI